MKTQTTRETTLTLQNLHRSVRSIAKLPPPRRSQYNRGNAMVGNHSFANSVSRRSWERAVDSHVGLPAASRNFQQHNANIHLHPLVGHGFAAAAPRFRAPGPSPAAAILCAHDTRSRELFPRGRMIRV